MVLGRRRVRLNRRVPTTEAREREHKNGKPLHEWTLVADLHRITHELGGPHATRSNASGNGWCDADQAEAIGDSAKQLMGGDSTSTTLITHRWRVARRGRELRMTRATSAVRVYHLPVPVDLTSSTRTSAETRSKSTAGGTAWSLLALGFMFVGCTSDAKHEDPKVVPDVSSKCGPAARLVTDVCTQLGGDDGCVAVDDVCVALCDGVTSCMTVDPTLRALSSFPIAPDGYCVMCTQQ